MTPEASSLDRLTREILHFEDLAIEHAESAVKFKAEIGTRLIAAKAILPHGEFLPWARKWFGWSTRHVQNHMTLARNAQRVSHLPGNSSLRMAMAAIAESRADEEHPQFTLKLDNGDEAVVELRTGDVEQLCATFTARAWAFRKVEKAA